jgi:predicted GNAT family acetyltransferase
MSELTFSNEAARHRYEARRGGALAAYVEYNLLGDNNSIVMFTHTEVLPEHEGKGVGSAIARHVLDEARRQGRQVVPVCQFVASYIRKHPEYAPLVREDVRRAFKIPG